jgi:hypothetical protein
MQITKFYLNVTHKKHVLVNGFYDMIVKTMA